MEQWRRIAAVGPLLLGLAVGPSAQDTGPPVGLEVGLTAPGFSLPDLLGNVHTLAQHRGEVVLVNF